MTRAVWVALACVGCGGAPAPANPRPARSDLAAVLGRRVAAPDPLSRVTPGMTVAELQAAVPGAVLEKSRLWLTWKGYRLPFAAAADIKLYAVVEGESVRDLAVVVDGADARSRIVGAWGEPDAESGRSFHEPTWRSVESHWRAGLTCDPAGTADPGCMLVLHRHRPLADMFATLAPPAPFDQLRIDMAEAESRKLSGLPHEHGRYEALDYDGAEADIMAVQGALREISFIAPASQRHLIEQKWGAPRTTVDDYAIWIDDKAGWSAYVDSFGKDEIKVSFANVVPVTTVVDALIAMAGRPASAIRADHPEMTPEHDWLALPSTDVAARPGDYDTMVLVEDRGGTAELVFILYSKYMVPGAGDTVLAELAARYGKPKPGRNKDNEKILVYSPHLTVGVNTPDELYVEVK